MQATDKREQLERFASAIRIETMAALGQLGFGHIGGCMSIVELLAVLYGGVMRYRPEDPGWPDRDWLVLSKGHAGPALYAALAVKGFFPLEELKTINQGGTRLPSHADRQRTPGVDISTGSLGQGFSSGLGAALGHRIDGRSNRVFIILGDGECQEGQIWEGALWGGNAALDNLVVFVDYNRQQLDGYVMDISPMEPFARKWESFGWHVQQVDGHDVIAVDRAIEEALDASGRSSVILLDTKKGYGCSLAEGKTMNHHMRFSKEEMDQAIHDWKIRCGEVAP